MNNVFLHLSTKLLELYNHNQPPPSPTSGKNNKENIMLLTEKYSIISDLAILERTAI